MQAKNELQREPSEELRNLQEELVACKLREAEANLSMKELRQKVTDVERHWEVCGALYLLLWYSHMYLRFGDTSDYMDTSLCQQMMFHWIQVVSKWDFTTLNVIVIIHKLFQI